MTFLLALIPASADAESATGAAPRATATTTAKLSGPVPTMTVSMPAMFTVHPPGTPVTVTGMTAANRGVAAIPRRRRFLSTMSGITR
jgi:hypothetical protein